ncbi:MAG: hypothetical protein PHV39_06205 [Methanomicrobium sp.]|nr:hypothetical protein [Methanomicrobium sp.]
MTWIGNPELDQSFNAIASRRMPTIPPEEIIKRPVWLTREIAGDHEPPSHPRNKRIVRDWYNNKTEAWSAGAVFYKYRIPAYPSITHWNIRIFCWILDYQDLLERFGPDWLMGYEHHSVTPEYALRHLWGITGKEEGNKC